MATKIIYYYYILHNRVFYTATIKQSFQINTKCECHKRKECNLRKTAVGEAYMLFRLCSLYAIWYLWYLLCSPFMVCDIFMTCSINHNASIGV